MYVFSSEVCIEKQTSDSFRDICHGCPKNQPNYTATVITQNMTEAQGTEEQSIQAMQ